jgi:hypothetical protein
MSAASASAMRGLVPFKQGYDPRRATGPRLSPAELEFKQALEDEHIPKANELLRQVYADAMAGSIKDRELFFKVCGLIKKPSDDAAIQETAKALLGEMIAEVKARRADPGRTG